jgi:hypothetical protein
VQFWGNGKKQHRRIQNAGRTSENNQKPIRPFVLYSLRHTFLTRLGESGCNVGTLPRPPGIRASPYQPAISHPSDDAVAMALAQLQASQKYSTLCHRAARLLSW